MRKQLAHKLSLFFFFQAFQTENVLMEIGMDKNITYKCMYNYVYLNGRKDRKRRRKQEGKRACF